MAMKLLQRDRRLLETVLGQLQRAERFLVSEETLVCRRKRMATTTIDLTNAQGTVCQEIDKCIGSELCLFFSAIHNLTVGLS
jgi:hypothetical protein